MPIREFARRLGVSTRVVRHYEATGLLSPSRRSNGYRFFTRADLRRGRWIRSLIAAGFSTREIRTVVPCAEDAGAVAGSPCEATLRTKLAQIDRLIGQLRRRREAVLERLAFANGPGAGDEKGNATR